MASINLIRGMGSFFKQCEHPESRWSQQTEESGFTPPGQGDRIQK